MAALVNADPKEIIWTSGATESDNLAIKGAAHFYRKKGNHIITLKTEHKAVLDTCRQLEREGFEVSYLDVQPNGLLDLDADGLTALAADEPDETVRAAAVQALADIDHPYGAKRPPIDTDYFETFNRDNVSLVDVRADPIKEITPTGVRLESGAEHEAGIGSGPGAARVDGRNDRRA